MKTAMIEVCSEYHATKCTKRARVVKMGYDLSPRQVHAAWHKICGIPGCRCWRLVFRLDGIEMYAVRYPDGSMKLIDDVRAK